VITVLRNRETSSDKERTIDNASVVVRFLGVRLYRCRDHLEINKEPVCSGFKQNKRIVK